MYIITQFDSIVQKKRIPVNLSSHIVPHLPVAYWNNNNYAD